METNRTAFSIMKKAEKNQIKQVLSLQKEILNVLSEKIQLENVGCDIVFSVLQECQQAVITVGMKIEEAQADSAHIIGILEEYCEELYQIAKKAEIGIEVIPLLQKAAKRIEDILGKVEELPEKKIVCFLPYKASMWDSLESVWKTMHEDSNFETYVIPIPYFVRKPDGSFGEMHYEGNEYPSYVPITHYENVHLEEMKPDKIFIHNPYDEYNAVTSVHPAFYASRLKDYTKELVYIPYFVLEEIEPEDTSAVESMEHFCLLPAVLYAHKVIVQSEKMKQVYIKVLTKHKGKHTRTRWEEKIFGLGSPKFDKVKSVSKEEITIPKEWKQILQRPDGTWKKVVFYNTSITAFLKHNKQMLKKMADVFRVFEEIKDDIVLLWRPHPLLISTMAAMCPYFLEDYQKLVNEYKEKQIGIYDDTADLSRAITLVDAYFGDPSSVANLCQKAGMPVMIQNVDVMYE